MCNNSNRHMLKAILTVLGKVDVYSTLTPPSNSLPTIQQSSLHPECQLHYSQHFKTTVSVSEHSDHLSLNGCSDQIYILLVKIKGISAPVSLSVKILI